MESYVGLLVMQGTGLIIKEVPFSPVHIIDQLERLEFYCVRKGRFTMHT